MLHNDVSWAIGPLPFVIWSTILKLSLPQLCSTATDSAPDGSIHEIAIFTRTSKTLIVSCAAVISDNTRTYKLTTLVNTLCIKRYIRFTDSLQYLRL